MRAAFAVAALLAASPVFAQSPTVYHLDVDANDLVNMGAAFNELPKKVADPLIAKLQAQINAQNAAVAEAAKKAAETAKAKDESKPETDKTP
jgi:hypothetical protein